MGIVTYQREDGDCELAFIAAFERHRGIGTALLEAVLGSVAGCDRIWVVTTDESSDAGRKCSIVLGGKTFGRPKLPEVLDPD